MEGLFAGLDVSTQSCKLVVIDLGERVTVHVDAVSYDEDLPHYGTRDGTVQGPDAGASESDPAMWIEAVALLLQRLEAAPKVEQRRIQCLAVSGQQHGLVALDEGGNLARPRAKLWNDFSTTEECRLLTERVGGTERMISEVGNTQRTGYTAPKILHMLRHEPECYARATTLFLVHNYINWYLTGGANGGVAVMEPGDTSGTALWHPLTGAWSQRVLDAIDPGLARKLPPVEPSDRTIGTLAPRLAQAYGLSTACAIDAGSGDNMYAAIGTGNFAPGIVTVSLGTSGTAYTFLKEPYVDPEGEIAAFCDSTGHHLPLVCVSNMANGYNAVLERFGMGHEEFDAVIARTGAGNGGRLLIPWYTGERTPDLPNAAPIYFGFAMDDFDRERLSRAVLEGHVLNLWSGFRKLPVRPTAIHLTGGLSRSPAWCQMIADMFEAETVPVEGEGAALGAAIHAAWVCAKEQGQKVSLAEVAEPFVVLDVARRKTPIARNVEIYRIQKRLYLALSERARGIDTDDDPFALRWRLGG
ncbi:MAG: FGGY family carbohydrate kinase [Gemmatimonadota bacterium]|nr:FGGY family carbohydrate kinase [Gemmatimonadota bacterium]MDH3368047.1 FGGY family carbohydrate kinase [Gemmatimonadota bacterium]MDH3477807.1 FGGY family carbohydrate kinase [Gemmatimonadota bacterium]MDH5550745.1 FGGY family carbohydrate kinase [Gemmatimonadota bacterium]